MKQHGALCDVRLICPLDASFGDVGVEIVAHKSVLASGCAFFYAQFTSEYLASGEEQNSTSNDALIMDARVRYGVMYRVR